MSARSKARKAALDILFESDLRGRSSLATLEQRVADAETPLRDYTLVLVEGVTAHQAEIDRRIAVCLSGGWTLQRMPRVDRTAVRIAVYEIDFLEVPDAVAAAEAVALVADLSTDDSPDYVNGLLGTLIATKPGDAAAAETSTEAQPSPTGEEAQTEEAQTAV